MAELFKTDQFKPLKKWFLTLNMTSIRTCAEDTGAITYTERQTLDALEVKGSQTHNARLLDMVRETDSRDAFERLAKAVRDLGEAYEPKYTEMMAILDFGKAEARRQDPSPPFQQEFVPDLFDKEEYKVLRFKLVQAMEMDTARLSAEAYSLITKTQLDKLGTTFEPKGRSVHNRELFRMIEVGGPQALGKFSDKVLADLEMPDYQAKLNRIGRGL